MKADDTMYVPLEPDNVRKIRKRHRIIRVIIPISFVVVIIAALLTIAYQSYYANRKAALVLSNDLLKALEQRISIEVQAYLKPAVNMVELVANLVGSQAFQATRKSEIEPLAMEVLQTYPQLAMFNIADLRGNFLMPKKMPDGSIHTKIIERRNQKGFVTWVRRNISGEITGTETSMDNTYDPRVRPWYVGAVKEGGIFWTDVYIFFTDKKPGITASYPVRDSNNNICGVLGLDFELVDICLFLKELQIGKSGAALIVSKEGQVVAYPERTRMIKQVGEKLKTVTIDELGEPTMIRAFNHYRVSGSGQRILEVADRRYISLIAALPEPIGNKWLVLIVVPEDDFVGFVASNNRRSLILSLGIVAICAGLAVLLAIQALRADKNALMVLDRQRQMEVQSTAFSELTGNPDVFDPESTDGIHQLTEVMADGFGAYRAGVWAMKDNCETLVCEDVYDRGAHGHTGGMELKRENFNRFFEEILSGSVMAVSDAAVDPRADELDELYLKSLGSRSILLVPILIQGKVSGVISFEHRTVSKWSPEEISFAQAVAGLVSTRFSNKKYDLEECVPLLENESENKEKKDDFPEAEKGFGKGAAGRSGLDEKRLSAEFEESPPEEMSFKPINDVTILFVELDADIESSGDVSSAASISFLEKLTETIGSLAWRHGISHKKMMGDRFVCFPDVSMQTGSHVKHIADLALNLQREFARLFDDLSLPMQIRFGMDTGGAIGQIDKTGRLLNLWGEVMSGASAMANYGVPGEIQVAESTYNLLKTEYLMQDRGRFFIGDRNEITTYLLSGKL